MYRTQMHLTRIAAIVVTLGIPLSAPAGSPRQVRWADLWIVLDKSVTIAMPGGEVVTGKAVGLDSQALLVYVEKTTAPQRYAKGELRIPRTELHMLRVRNDRNALKDLSYAGIVCPTLLPVFWAGGLWGSRGWKTLEILP